MYKSLVNYLTSFVIAITVILYMAHTNRLGGRLTADLRL